MADVQTNVDSKFPLLNVGLWHLYTVRFSEGEQHLENKQKYEYGGRLKFNINI
jgi:hypothetical protein